MDRIESARKTISESFHNLPAYISKVDAFLDIHDHTTAISELIFDIVEKQFEMMRFESEAQEAPLAACSQCLDHLADLAVRKDISVNWGTVNAAFVIWFGAPGFKDRTPEIINALFKRFPDYDINAGTKHLEITVLMASVYSYEGDIGLIRYLVDCGANIHQQSRFNGKALHFINVIDSRHEEKLLCLLDMGADPKEKLRYQYYGYNSNRLLDPLSFIDFCLEDTQTKKARAGYEAVVDICNAGVSANQAAAAAADLVDDRRKLSL